MGGWRLKLEHRELGHNLVVRLAGELDLVAAEQFRRLVDERLDSRRTRNLYVNLEQVTFLDSSFLGALLGRYRRIKQAGGRMGLVRAPGPVRPALEISGILRLLEEYRSEPEALAAVADS